MCPKISKYYHTDAIIENIKKLFIILENVKKIYITFYESKLNNIIKKCKKNKNLINIFRQMYKFWNTDVIKYKSKDFHIITKYTNMLRLYVIDKDFIKYYMLYHKFIKIDKRINYILDNDDSLGNFEKFNKDIIKLSYNIKKIISDLE